MTEQALATAKRTTKKAEKEIEKAHNKKVRSARQKMQIEMNVSVLDRCPYVLFIVPVNHIVCH